MEDGVVRTVLAKSAIGLEKNLPPLPGTELPVFKTVAFSSEAKPKDSGPVDLSKEQTFKKSKPLREVP